MGYVVPLVIVAGLTVLMIAIIKLEQVKRLVLFLGFGLVLSIAIIMIGRIWDPKLSAWWVLLVEAALLITFYVKTKYEEA